MGGPKRQHYIPRSYLKKFTDKKDKLFLVDTLQRGSNATIRQVSVNDICIKKNLYTFPPGVPGDRFALEKFYATEVDDLYPRVYDMLINPKTINIDDKEKAQILNTVLSLFFRTPRFLENRLRELDDFFDFIKRSILDPEKEIKASFTGEQWIFKGSDLEAFREKKMQEARQSFLSDHLKNWQDYVTHRMDANIQVVRSRDDTPLITSDSPIMIMQQSGKLVTDDIFDPSNIVEVPLDRYHYLIIYPDNVGEKAFSKIISRVTRDRRFIAGVNLKTAQNAYSRVISFPGDITIDAALQNELGAWNEKNLNMVNEMRQMAEFSALLEKTINQNGTIYCQPVAQIVTQIRKTKLMNGDDTFEMLILLLSQNGFITHP